MRKLLCTLFAIAVGLYGIAQNGSIEGYVYGADSSSTLSGVHIFIPDLQQGAVSNGNGFFAVRDIPAGKYTMTASSVGYMTVSKSIQVREDDVARISFVVVEAISALQEVFVMTKGIQGLKDIPGSVHYISPKDIEKFSYTDINRAFRAVPGVNLQEEDGFGLRPNIGLRGTGVERSAKITIMEDGVLAAPAPYADPSAYYFPTIGRMQAIEVLKGSSQIKYGPFTTGGAINLISTQIPEAFGGRITLLGGSFGGRNLHANVGNSHKHVAYAAETYQYSSDGFKQLDGGGNTGFDKKDFMGKLRFQTSEDARIYQSLTIKAGITNETSNETYLGLTEADFEANPYRRYAGSQKDLMRTEHEHFAMTHHIRLPKIITVTTTAYRSDFARNWYKLDRVRDTDGTSTSISGILEDPDTNSEAYQTLTGDTGPDLHALLVRANNRSYRSEGIQTNIRLAFKSRKLSHHLDIGARYHRDEADRFQWDDAYEMREGVMYLTNAGTPGTESNRIESAKAFASFVQYQLKIGKFTATPGLRFEHIRMERMDYGKADPGRTGSSLSTRMNEVDVFIPGIGLDYHFNRYLRVFGGVHKGFSPPGSQDETEPEASINTELGAGYRKNALSGQLILFYNDYSNLLGSDLAASGGGGTGDLFNAGEVSVRGIEFEIQYDLLASRTQSALSLPVSLVYTFTDAEFQKGFESSNSDWGVVGKGDQLPYLAKHQWTCTVGLEHANFGITVSGRYMDEMRTVPGHGDLLSHEKTDAYLIFDASANYLVHRNIALFVNALNLTDSVYRVAKRPAGWRSGMPFAVNAGVKVTF
jgi:Fe(3+) dicitrate transport protein